MYLSTPPTSPSTVTIIPRKSLDAVMKNAARAADEWATRGVSPPALGRGSAH